MWKPTLSVSERVEVDHSTRTGDLSGRFSARQNVIPWPKKKNLRTHESNHGQLLKHPGDPWVTWWEISITSYEPPLEPWVVYPSEIRKKERTCRHERLKRRLTRFPHDVVEPFRDVGPLGLETTQNAWETVRNYLRCWSWSPAEHVFNIDSTCFCWLNTVCYWLNFTFLLVNHLPERKGKGEGLPMSKPPASHWWIHASDVTSSGVRLIWRGWSKQNDSFMLDAPRLNDPWKNTSILEETRFTDWKIWKSGRKHVS
jgi:hypothetical protein